MLDLFGVFGDGTVSKEFVLKEDERLAMLLGRLKNYSVVVMGLREPLQI